MSVGYSRRTRVRSSRRAATRAASSRCSSASTPSFSRPGSSPRSRRMSCSTSCELNPQRLALRIPSDDLVVGLFDRARRVHPVERLVRLGVGVNRDRAVGLAHEQSHRAPEARAQPSLVDDRAAGDEQAHPRSLARRGPYPGRVQPPLPPTHRPRGRGHGVRDRGGGDVARDRVRRDHAPAGRPP